MYEIDAISLSYLMPIISYNITMPWTISECMTNTAKDVVT